MLARVSRLGGFGARGYCALAARQFDVLIVGGGSAGVGLASNWLDHATAPIRQSGEKLSFGIIEPSEYHYYQPLWTLVGGSTPGCSAESSRKETRSLIPHGADLIVDRVTSVDPNANQVILESGERIRYDLLVVATGLEVNFDQIKGLREALDDPNSPVCSNYSYDYCQKTARLVDEFKGGEACFSFPTGPVKCAGAPQKIMYLAHAAWKEKSLNFTTRFTSAIEKIFAVDKYRLALVSSSPSLPLLWKFT